MVALEALYHLQRASTEWERRALRVETGDDWFQVRCPAPKGEGADWPVTATRLDRADFMRGCCAGLVAVPALAAQVVAQAKQQVTP
jgi:hypothetical protein